MNTNKWIDRLKEYYKEIAPKPYKNDDLARIKVVESFIGSAGRMISGSKSSYKGNAVFNANLCTNKRKLWFGDIDLDKDFKKLQSIANELKETIYILREMDARFENENSPKFKNAVLVIKPKLL